MKPQIVVHPAFYSIPALPLAWLNFGDRCCMCAFNTPGCDGIDLPGIPKAATQNQAPLNSTGPAWFCLLTWLCREWEHSDVVNLRRHLNYSRQWQWKLLGNSLGSQRGLSPQTDGPQQPLSTVAGTSIYERCQHLTQVENMAPFPPSNLFCEHHLTSPPQKSLRADIK